MTRPSQPGTPPPLTLEQLLSLRAALPGKVSTELLVGFPCEGQVSLVWWDRAVESLTPEEHHFTGFDFKIIHDEGETDSPIWQFLAQALRIAALAEAQAEELVSLRAEVAELRSAKLDRPLMTWMAGTDSGASSESLVCCYLGLTPRFGFSEPADSGDFGRCYRLLLRFPEIRPCVERLAVQHLGWARLAPIWDELMQMAKEDGLEQRNKGSDRIYARIRAARWPTHALAPAGAGEAS